MFTEITEFVNKNSRLSANITGFRTGYGCRTAFLKVTDEIIMSTDKDPITVLTSLNFSIRRYSVLVLDNSFRFREQIGSHICDKLIVHNELRPNSTL